VKDVIMAKRQLVVYVEEGCWSCQEVPNVLAAVAPRFPQLDFRLRDLRHHPTPDNVFAVPSYVLDGKVIFLGNPTPEQLARKLAETH
jgi:hypothetical protein